MKNFTLFIFFALIALTGHSQCIRTYQGSPATSNNLGFVQELSTCSWTDNDFVPVSNLIVGKNYIFTCKIEDTSNYITVTDENNAVIHHGPSPLTVSAISSTNVRLHLSDNASCEGVGVCHTVTAQLILDCPLPSALAISNLGTDQATFNWEPQGSETDWEVIVLPSTSPAPAVDATQGVIAINDNPQYIATLSAATSYKFYYRAVCSPTEKSPWNSSNAFTTLCEEVTSFSQGFDASSTSLPNCWSKVGTQGYVYAQSSNNSASLPNNLYISSGSTSPAVLALPIVSNFDSDTHRIRFKMRSSYGTGATIEFGYLVDALDPASFVSLQSFTATSDAAYDEYTFEPGTTPETGSLAFRQPAGATSAVLLDDIIWEPIPACSDVTAFQVVSFTSNTAELSWTSAESSFEIAYGTSVDTDPNEVTPESLQATSATLSDLQPNTTYRVWVRSTCSADQFGAWIGPKIFKTNCGLVTSFVENFDASTSLPSCVKRVGNGGNAYVQSATGAPSSPNVLNLSSYMNNDSTFSYGMVALPSVSNAAAGTHRLKFNARSASSVGGVIEVGYVTNADNPVSFVSLQSFTTNSTSTFQTFIYIPAAGAIQAELLALRHSGTPSPAVYIDNVIWEVAPACMDVTAIQSANVTNNSAKLSWTGNTETAWQVAYGPSMVTDPATLTPVDVTTDSNTILSSLNASTTYKVWVRSNCGSAGFGAWIGPISFKTSCDPLSSFTENFDASTEIPNCWAQVGSGWWFLQSNSSPASAPNNVYLSSNGIMAMPPVSNASAGTHRLKFKARGTYAVGAVVEVGYLITLNDASSFVGLQTFTPTSADTYTEFYANLGTAPQTGYLALKHTGNSYEAVSIDDVVWEPIPTCEDVGGLENDFITNTTAIVSWTAEYSDAWEVAYTFEDDATLPSNLPLVAALDNEFTFSDLDPDTNYKFWVRSDCGNGQYGAWIGPKLFRTACNPLNDLPWAEDFENETVPNMPACWTEDGNWEQTNNTSSATSPNSGYQYIINYNGAVNDHMWTPGFELEANTHYDFSTFVQGDGYDGWSVAMVANTSPKRQGAVQLGELYNVPAGVGPQPYVEMRRTFTPATSGVYYFAVKVNENSTGNPFFLAFDDFMVENSTLGTPDFDNNSFVAYPNPVKDVLKISNTKDITNIAVFNLLGQQVMATTNTTNRAEINMSGLAQGTYLIKITSDNQVKTLKVIKE